MEGGNGIEITSFLDYCQIEFRILAYLSHDQKLTSLLNQKHDVFKLIASQM
jgi:DNA polymerase I-like protein with 3'-5' exonuclease and polymerase domains